MRMPQMLGIAVTAAVVMWVDLPIDWLVFVAMLCGALATAVAEVLLRGR